MRFLHTADWHIGKSLRAQRRDTEYEAVLQEILQIARDEQVDAVLVAGDVFDSSSPPADAERLVYQFFCDLFGAGIRAVVIGGNHDHPQRLRAIAPLLSLAQIHLCPEAMRPETGGVLQLPSRDGSCTATVAVLPWVPERRVVESDSLFAGQGQPYTDYAGAMSNLLQILSGSFRAETVNVLLGHLFVDGVTVGKEGGERPIHLGQAFAVTPSALPTTAQYVALGHIHRGQQLTTDVPAWYPGSLLQLDFGEAGQEKGVMIVDIRPGLPADVRRIPLSAGRRLRDLECTLDELGRYASEVGDDFLRVRVRLDEPVTNLAEKVRAILPNALDVQRAKVTPLATPDQASRLQLGPTDLMRDFYQRHRGHPIPEATLSLFQQLYDEVQYATDPA
jgi:DNA repair protein SbcD/Mre11